VLDVPPVVEQGPGVETSEPASLPAESPSPVQPAPAPVVAEPTVVEPPVAEPPAATVEPVTEPAPVPAPQLPELPPGHRLPDLAPGQDPQGSGSIGPDGQYTPDPPRINPGEPPLADNWNQKPPPAEPLPGEPGYTGPVVN
jgi:hypothetical protein